MKPLLIAAARSVFALRRPSKAENEERLAHRGESLADLVIREATIADLSPLARLHVETWRSTYQDLTLFGKVSAPTFAIREAQWREAFAKNDGSWFCYVIERKDGELVGFVKGVRGETGKGELSKVYLLRDYQRLGLGRQLIALVARRFLAQGVTWMGAYVDPANPSCGFFETLGGHWLREPDGKINYSWYVWTDLGPLAAAAEPAGRH